MAASVALNTSRQSWRLAFLAPRLVRTYIWDTDYAEIMKENGAAKALLSRGNSSWAASDWLGRKLCAGLKAEWDFLIGLASYCKAVCERFVVDVRLPRGGIYLHYVSFGLDDGARNGRSRRG